MTKWPSIRQYGVFLAFAVVISACSAAADPVVTTTVPATTVPPTSAAPTTTIAVAQAIFNADVELIDELWSGESVAFAEGFDSGLNYWVENNYPAMGCTYGDYLESRYPEGPIDGLRIERTVDELTIVADHGWVVPGGTLAGQVIDGRIYTMTVESVSAVPGTTPEPATVRNLHVTVLEGKAHFFLGCPG